VFVLQEQKTDLLSNGTRVETVPFIFAIGPTATLGIVRERLHGGCVSLDASFGAPVRVLPRRPLTRVPLSYARRCRRNECPAFPPLYADDTSTLHEGESKHFKS
jgi:hypothetical protein